MKPVFLFAISMIFTLAACTISDPVQTPTETPPITQDSSISASAKVIPEQYSNLSFANGGRLIKLLVETGQVVTSGQLIVQADQTQLKAAIAQAQAVLDQANASLTQLEKQPSTDALKAAQAAVTNAEANVKRQIDNSASKLQIDAAVASRDSAQASLDAVKAGASPEQLEIARANIRQAQAALDQANIALQQSEIKAPFEGQIVEVYKHNFETAAPGEPVILLADLNTLIIQTTDLGEVDAARLAVGMKVKVSFDALPGQDYFGIISRIALKSAPGSGNNFAVDIRLDKPPKGLRWGMSAFVVFSVP